MTRARKENKKEEKVKGTKVGKKIIINMKFLMFIRKGPLSGLRICTAACYY